MPTFDPAALPRVLAAAPAARLGITRAQLRTEIRHGRWQRLACGVVLTRPDAPTRTDWAEAGVALAGPGAGVTGWDALRALGLGDRNPPPGPPVVLMPRGLSRAVGGVRLRRTRRPYAVTVLPEDADRLALTPVVTVARAVADAAVQYRDPGRVRALVTSAIQRHRCRVDDLVAELEAGPRNGSALLRRALADVLDGARSAAEATAVHRLARAPVPAFELNVPILCRGELVAVADVLWRALRIALEIDSREFHFGEGEWKATMRRHNLLIRLGLAVTHYPPSALTAPGWAAEVAELLRARAAELGRPYPATCGVIRPDPEDGPAPFVIDAAAA